MCTVSEYVFLACPTSCSTCSADNVCTGCNTGYYLSGSTCAGKLQ